MQENSPRPRSKLYGGIAVSVALHAIIAGVILMQLPPTDITPPDEEETVSVEIVPPPEEEQPTEEEQALTVPEMEQSQPEEQPPPPPPEEQASEPAQLAGGEPPASAEAEPPAAEQQAQPEAQQAEAEPPPQPAEEMQQAEAEQPQSEEQEAAAPPPAEEPAQQQADTAPAGGEAAGEEQAAQGQPLPVLRPVFEYGDEASGSGVERSGNASEGEQAEESETAETNADAQPEDTPAEAAENTDSEIADAAAANGESETEAAAPNLPDDIETPTVEMNGAAQLLSSEEAEAEGTRTELAQEPKPDVTNEQVTATEKAESTPDKPQDEAAEDQPPRPARRLFTEQDSDADIARTAMGNVPRDIRAGQLCSTELTEQLRHGSRRFNPDIVPAFKLPEGTVLDVRQAAFRAEAQWYDIRFRCEVNENATRVVSFGLDIGQAVPRSEWRARRFPEF